MSLSSSEGRKAEEAGKVAELFVQMEGDRGHCAAETMGEFCVPTAYFVKGDFLRLHPQNCLRNRHPFLWLSIKLLTKALSNCALQVGPMTPSLLRQNNT